MGEGHYEKIKKKSRKGGVLGGAGRRGLRLGRLPKQQVKRELSPQKGISQSMKMSRGKTLGFCREEEEGRL